MSKKKKKGFTLVELLVVIAILAVLATVSILGYSAFVKKANMANDRAVVEQMNKALLAYETIDEKARYCDEAVDQCINEGFILENLTPSTSGFHFAYDQKYNRFMLLKEDHTYEYGDNNHTDVEVEPWNIFVVVGSQEEINTATKEVDGKLRSFSIYARGEFDFEDNTNTVKVAAGFDAGKCLDIKTVNYTNGIAAQDVVIRTNGGTLSVDGELDTVTHYGFATIVDVKDVKVGTYNEAGTVGRLIYEDNEGAVKFKPTAKVYCYMNISTDETADASETTKEEGATVFTNVTSAEAQEAISYATQFEEDYEEEYNPEGEDCWYGDDEYIYKEVSCGNNNDVILDKYGKVIVSLCENHNEDYDIVTIGDKEYVLCKCCGGFSLYEGGNKVSVKDDDPSKEAQIALTGANSIPYVQASHEHSGGTATCTHKAICTNCGQEYGSLGSNNHNWGNWTSDNTGKHTRTCQNNNAHTETGTCDTNNSGACSVCWYKPHVHSYTYVDNHNGTHNKTCSCGDASATNQACTMENGKCKYCWYHTEHKWNNTTHTCERCKDAVAYKLVAAGSGIKDGYKAQALDGPDQGYLIYSVCGDTISFWAYDSEHTEVPNYFQNSTSNSKTYLKLFKDIDGSAHDYSKTPKVIIQEGITRIGAAAFNYVNGLTSVTLPSSLRQIEAYAFANIFNTNYNEIEIPEGVQEIYGLAFYSTTLNKITLPSTLTKIEPSLWGIYTERIGNSGLTRSNTASNCPFYTYNSSLVIEYRGTTAQWIAMGDNNKFAGANAANYGLYVKKVVCKGGTSPQTLTYSSNGWQ